MNILIYPACENMTTVEKFCSNPPLNYNFTYVKDTDIQSLDITFGEKINDINSFVIFKDDYGKFIEQNITFILNNKHIMFFIQEVDIHYIRSKNNAYNRYLLLRLNLIDNPHIFILASAWYLYKKLYSIHSRNLIAFPFSVSTERLLEPSSSPIMKVLLSGSTSGSYPMRRYLKKLQSPLVDVLTHDLNIRGDEYLKYLNKYVCAFVCCLNHTTPYIVNKFFEIPGVGCLLLAYDEFVKDGLKEIGFIDGVNYISCNKHNILDKIDYICNEANLTEINKIRINGYNLVKDNHTRQHRYELLEQLTTNTQSL